MTFRPGDVVLDAARHACGVVRTVDAATGRLLLARPGGPAWTADPADVRPATRAEELSLKVATANRWWGR